MSKDCQHMDKLQTCALTPPPRNAEDGWKAATDEMATVATTRDRSIVQVVQGRERKLVTPEIRPHFP
jgi:hypothetical protein